MPVRPKTRSRSEGLGLWERFALGTGRLINDTRAGRAVQNVYLRGVGYVWMRATLNRQMLVEGSDGFRDLDPDRGVLVVANHRSMFDFYAITVACYAAPAAWIRRIRFPVRANFFYTNPLGLVVNLAACMGAMYPPIYRDRARARFNRDSLDRLATLLDERGWMVGFHPEGTRGKGPDPYELLPMHPGAGELALKSGAVVVPVFVNGISASLTRVIGRALAGGDRTNPFICVFGPPLRLEHLVHEASAQRGREAVELFAAGIRSCAARERELRQACATGKITADDRRWLDRLPGSRLYGGRLAAGAAVEPADSGTSSERGTSV